MRIAGSSPAPMRAASCAQAGTRRVGPYAGVQTRSVLDGPCCGLKKHGVRRSGSVDHASGGLVRVERVLVVVPQLCVKLAGQSLTEARELFAELDHVLVGHQLNLPELERGPASQPPHKPC